MSSTKLLIGISLAALAAASASAQDNTSTYNQTGTNNSAAIDNLTPGNIGNNTVISQNGTSNSATVIQRQNFNRSFVQQIGTFNRGTHQQAGQSNNADSRSGGDFNTFGVTQVGQQNSATLVQDGFNNRNTVEQGIAFIGATGETRTTAFNLVTVDQNGAGLRSTVRQRGATAAAPAADENRAEVVQRSAGSGEALQQQSVITQESRGDFARLVQGVGDPSAPNASTVTQRDSARRAGDPASQNTARVTQNGLGLNSEVAQDGRRNSTTLSMRGGGLATSQRQLSTITQTGADHRATVTFGQTPTTAGLGNTGAVTQSGTGHAADVFQYGSGDRSTVVQANNGDAFPGGNIPRSSAFVSQNASGAQSTVNQTGLAFADVVQAFGSNSVITVAQVDAGDVAITGRPRNSVLAAQYGNVNQASASQNAASASATVWQRTGSANNALEILQGVGATGRASTTSTPGFGPGATGANARGLSASVVQGAFFNSATLYQDGASLTGAIDQAGSGAAALPNIAFISQTGTGNSAGITQRAGVAPSAAGDVASGNAGAEFAFAGGARSAEARILQTSSGNSATVVQEGRGQFARIEQSGPNNVGDILQQTGATNATAVIRQSGAGNSYFVVQNQPGQYVSVTQAGNGNVATQVVQSGATGGYNGFTPPPQ